MGRFIRGRSVGLVVIAALGLPLSLSGQAERERWLPGVTAGLHLSRSAFHRPYRGYYRTDLAPLVSIGLNRDLGSGFGFGLGLQYVDQRLTGLGPTLRYRLEYLEVPITVRRSLGRLGPISADVHAGGLVGVPLRCRAVSAVPGGSETTLGCGEDPIAVEKHRLEASLRVGASARARFESTWLGLSAALQHGLRDVYGEARVTTLLLGAEIGR
jgi:hypothetical protein